MPRCTTFAGILACSSTFLTTQHYTTGKPHENFDHTEAIPGFAVLDGRALLCLRGWLSKEQKASDLRIRRRGCLGQHYFQRSVGRHLHVAVLECDHVPNRRAPCRHTLSPLP